MAQALFTEENTFFQEKNNSIHTARIVEEWHEEHYNEVEHLLWPAQSPDLNIIEHLWPIQVRHRFPLPSFLKELEDILTEEWLKISLETTHKLNELIFWRIDTVIVARGGQTPY